MVQKQLSMRKLWPSPLQYDHESRSWYDILSRSNMTVGSMAWTRFWVCVQCDIDLGNITLGQGHDTPLDDGQQVCDILSSSNSAVRRYGIETDFGYVCTVTLTLAALPLVMVLSHPWLGSWTISVDILPSSNFAEWWPWHWFSVYVHCGLDLGDLTLGQGHDTPLVHEQHLCEIFPRSNLADRRLRYIRFIILSTDPYLHLSLST